MPVQSLGTEEGAPARWRYALPLILCAAFAVVAPMLVLGSPDGHDFEFHVTTWIGTVQEWRAGVWYPRWDSLANYGFGEPRFLFYPPLSRLLGAAALFIGPANAAPAAYYFLVVLIAGVSMFALVRQWLPPAHAVIAAGFYAVNPYLLLCIYQRSAAAELLAAALFPLLALFAFRLPAGNRAIVPLAAVFAVFWISDLPAAVIVTYALALSIVVLAFVHRSLAVLLRGTAGMILGFGLVAFYVLPAAYEQRWVNINEAVSPEFRPENWEYTWAYDPEAEWFYALISGLVYFEIAAVVIAGAASWSRFRQRALWWVFAIVAAICVFMLLPVSDVAWTHLPKLEFVQFPWRCLVVLTACMTVFFALALARLQPRWLALLLLAVAAVGGAAPGATALWNRGAVEYYQEVLSAEGGYEGSTQFMAAGTSSQALKGERSMPLVIALPSPATLRVLRWDPHHKAVEAKTANPTKIIFRLLNYPGWRATVNGHPVNPASDRIGRLEVPVPAGESRVEVQFANTFDRTLGLGLSLVAALILAGLVLLA